MKYAILSVLPLAFLSISDLRGEELSTEITSGQYCQSELFKQFKKTEQTNHERLKFKPSDKLLQFVTSMELMCPWESLKDYNGDKRDDWIGFVKSGSKYQLVGYLSTQKSYQFEVIASSESIPKNTFIRWIQTPEIERFTKNKIPLNSLKYALQVSNFEGMTEFYLWEGKKMKSVLTTPQMF